jgi:hypothetical protein
MISPYCALDIDVRRKTLGQLDERISYAPAYISKVLLAPTLGQVWTLNRLNELGIQDSLLEINFKFKIVVLVENDAFHDRPFDLSLASSPYRK